MAGTSTQSKNTAKTTKGKSRRGSTFAQWDDEKDRVILEALMGQKDFGKASDTSFRTDAYAAAAAAYNEVFSPAYTQGQIKSRINKLKDDYGIFQKLKEESEFGWNEERQVPTASDEVWRNYIRTHKGVARFRDETLVHYELLNTIFSSMFPAGKGASSKMPSAPASENDGFDPEPRTSDSNVERDESEALRSTVSDSEAEASAGQPRKVSRGTVPPATPEPATESAVSKRGRATTQTSGSMTGGQSSNVTSGAKRARIRTGVDSYSLQSVAARIRQGWNLSPLEKALEVMNGMLGREEITAEQYQEGFELLKLDDRNCVFMYTADVEASRAWLLRRARPAGVLR